MLKWLLPLLLLALSGFAEAPDVRSLGDGETPGEGTLEDIDWLVGRWVGEGLGGQTEEVYSPPFGGQMMGMFRYARDGALGFYEFVLFEEREGSLVFRVRHFNPDFSGWEEKGADQTVDFPLVAIDGDTAYFDGTTFRNNGDGTMDIGLRIRTKDGSRLEQFSYRRAD